MRMRLFHLDLVALVLLALCLATVTRALADDTPPGGWPETEIATVEGICDFTSGNGGSCFGTGDCESSWNNPAFNCNGVVGDSLQRRGFRRYGTCKTNTASVFCFCPRFTGFGCSWWFVYLEPDCSGDPICYSTAIATGTVCYDTDSNPGHEVECRITTATTTR